MKYTKPPLTFEQQADLLIQRGLLAPDKKLLVERLQAVNYYRLSAYWHPFKQGDEKLAPGTTLDIVWGRYVFDRQLRLLVMDAIERIEIAVRTRMVEFFVNKHGPFGYIDRSNFSPDMPVGEHNDFMERLRKNTRESREEFVHHFFEKYTAHRVDLPLWMAVEIMTFGNMLTMFKRLEFDTKRALANMYGIAAKVLESWLLTLNYVRNLCAHHSRLWNRELSIKPLIPDKNPEWHSPILVENHRVFSILTLLRYMLMRVAPQSHWQARLEDLLTKHPAIPIKPMGFPEDWKMCPIWRPAAPVNS